VWLVAAPNDGEGINEYSREDLVCLGEVVRHGESFSRPGRFAQGSRASKEWKTCHGGPVHTINPSQPTSSQLSWTCVS